jgi:UPF0176 protein
MKILNIAGYKFITLTALSELQTSFLEKCRALSLKGTILLSAEGINITLSGEFSQITAFKDSLLQDERFADITFRESLSETVSFKRLKIKLKNEIITLRRPEVRPENERAPSISPEEFKQWLDENRDITILDTRNDYEVKLGTFDNAINLHIGDFSEFPKAAEAINRDKPVVMFCTGGIRCEKAGIHLLNAGFPNVYQLEGGILNYFTRVGSAHYHGDCFVFDERVALNPKLEASNTTLP